jgi:hypothetical protein
MSHAFLLAKLVEVKMQTTDSQVDTLAGDIRLQASNESTFVASAKMPSPVAFFESALGAPPDWPHKRTALRNAVFALDVASASYPEFSKYIQTDLLPAVKEMQTQTTSERNLLVGRTQGHALYIATLQLTSKGTKNQANWREVNHILGMWILRRYLVGVEPTKASISALRRHMHSSGDVQQATRSLQLMAAKATEGLTHAIKQAPAAAGAIGLTLKYVQVNVEVETPHEERLNREYQARVKQLIKYANERSVKGTVGHGTLAKSAVKQVGQQLMREVLAGESSAVCVCLQVLTWMTPVELKNLPIKTSSEETSSLAWLDLKRGVYCYSLNAVRQKKAPVSALTAHLYRRSSPIVSIKLPDLLINALEKKFNARAVQKVNLSDLIEINPPNPRTAIVPSIGYRITLRRLQESLPHLLLSSSNRWIVALSTSTPWLVSKGRRPYSVVRQSLIDTTVMQMYQYLGWASKAGTHEEVLIGSDVCPRPESIGKVLGFLEQLCAAKQEATSIERLNVEAARYAFLVALCLALRDRVIYQVQWCALGQSDSVVVNDKDVRSEPPPPIPVTPYLTEGQHRWNGVVERLIANLKSEDSIESKDLLNRVQATFENGSYPLFSIGDFGVIQPAGTATWRSKLPPSLCLVGNFARHFWPLALMDKEVPQRLLDLLMRHQSDYLVHYYSRGSIHKWQQDANELREAMEGTIQEVVHEPGLLK